MRAGVVDKKRAGLFPSRVDPPERPERLEIPRVNPVSAMSVAPILVRAPAKSGLCVPDEKGGRNLRGDPLAPGSVWGSDLETAGGGGGGPEGRPNKRAR